MPKKAKANKRRAKPSARAAATAAPVQTNNGVKNGIGKTLGALVGTKLGLGPTLGSALGNLAQGGLARLFGKGDYTGFEVERNSLVIPRHADSVPLIGTQDGMIRVRHREYLQDIISSIPYVQTALVIQPTNGACFPWLTTLATVFEQYRIMGMVFEYKSLASTANNTALGLGSVMMATQYNTAIGTFANKRQILNHYFGCSTVPYRDLVHPIECKEMYDPLKLYFTRPPGVEVPNRDTRFEAFGNFMIATQGMPTNGQSIGELWVSYDIMLVKPRIQTGAQSVLVIDPIGPGPGDEITFIHEPEWPDTPDEVELSRLRKFLPRVGVPLAAEPMAPVAHPDDEHKE